MLLAKGGTIQNLLKKNSRISSLSIEFLLDNKIWNPNSVVLPYNPMLQNLLLLCTSWVSFQSIGPCGLDHVPKAKYYQKSALNAAFRKFNSNTPQIYSQILIQNLLEDKKLMVTELVCQQMILDRYSVIANT